MCLIGGNISEILKKDSMLDDKKLIRSIKDDGRDALRQVYECYRADMLALAMTFTGNQSTAEDIVHDVFVRFAGNITSLKIRTSLKGYLLTSVANQARNILRKKSEIPIGDENEITGNERCGPDNTIEQDETKKEIDKALGQLPDEQKEIIILHLQGGLKFTEIAREKKVSVNTVKSRYRYALEKMRSQLDCEVLR